MVDLALTPTPLIIALSVTNIILFIIAVFLFLRCRKLGKKDDPKKEEKNSLAGIADIAPNEFKPERFDLKPQDTIPLKDEPKPSNSGAVPGISIHGKSPLKLEDKLPEVEEAPKKKSARRKKAIKREPKVAVKEAVIKESGLETEKILLKKEEVASKEHEIVAEGVIKELTEMAPAKKATRRKKAVKKEPVEAAKEVILEKNEAPAQVPVNNKTVATASTGEGMTGDVQANLTK